MNRTLNILNAFGFQGGTVHQVAEITGCEVDELLYTDEESGELTTQRAGSHTEQILQTSTKDLWRVRKVIYNSG